MHGSIIFERKIIQYFEYTRKRTAPTISNPACRVKASQPPGSTPPPIRVTPHGLSIIPSTGGLRWIEVADSMRRSGRDDSAGKEVGIEDKSQVEKEMSPCPEQEAVHRRQPALVASYDLRQRRWSQFFSGPHTGRNCISTRTN
ncbi:hypothetical protein PoB_005851500 [Plakobranchus ocellatus]|uniref:Uncharacterized protein n=1 Tax=Plakobranchus ocellatus TaxID=259542 RepID=A0AAV4CK83_9GAST|nr:hypothetical protein PoB_005851500 [Plakobranchus ocellatus]